MSTIFLPEISTLPPKGVEKLATKEQLQTILAELNELQNLLYASAQYSVLIIIQGMDASGKDGLTRDVFTSMNPQGVRVYSFKEPTEEELAHDFLWRIHKEVPPRRMIHVFNRSHYEDVMITRVHGMINDDTAAERIKAINHFEQLLQTHSNTVILKFYLHISQKEQHERLQERITDPRKMWKYNATDFEESKKWQDYMRYYNEVINRCSAIPWTVVPADKNWYKSFVVATKLRDALKQLDMKYPGLKK